MPPFLPSNSVQTLAKLYRLFCLVRITHQREQAQEMLIKLLARCQAAYLVPMCPGILRIAPLHLWLTRASLLLVAGCDGYDAQMNSRRPTRAHSGYA